MARLPMMAVPVSSTPTPGSGSPWSSVTVPVIFPSMTDWAFRTVPPTKARPNTRTSAAERYLRVILWPLLSSPICLHPCPRPPARTGTALVTYVEDTSAFLLVPECVLISER